MNLKVQRCALMVSVAAAVIATPAHAQQAGVQPERVQPASAEPIAEILVTAQRRTERSQSVPISLTAFSSERLNELRVETAQDLQGKVPSLVVGNAGQTNRNVETFTIRGQGATFQSSPGVISYFAEVPLPQGNITGAQGGGAGMFYDLSSLQVLKGPQGTLFGRNTTGGAVLFEPKRPTNELEGYAQATVGSYNARGLEGAINLPVVDNTLLVRVAANYATRDGFTRDVLTGKNYDNRNRWSARLGVTFKPAEGIENYLLGYYLWSHTNGTSVVPLAYRPGSSLYLLYGAATVDAILAAQAQRGPRRVALSADPVDRTETWGLTDIFSARLNDELTLRNIVSYARLKNMFRDDSDGSTLPFRDTVSPDGTWSTNLDNLTEELQLQGTGLGEKLRYTAGGYFERSRPEGVQEQYAFTSRPIPPGTPARSVGGENRHSYALYAQATLGLGAWSSALEGLSLTAGYRYSWDHKYTFTSYPTGLREYNLGNSAPNWTVGLDYKAAAGTLLYAKISRGFKSGGANRTSVNPARATFRPEYVTSYEAGIKADWHLAGMPIRTNLDYYYSDYTDIQRTGSDAFGGFFGSATVNAGKARIQGIEAEVTLRPVSGLELSGAYSYTDAKYQRFDLPVVNSAGTVTGSVDLSGIPFQFAPKHIASLGARYTSELGRDRGTLVASVNYAYTSQQYTSPTAAPSAEPYAYIPGYGLLNLSLTWRGLMGTPLDATIFATNVADRTYIVSSRASYGSGYATVVYGEPRMYGLQLRYRFGGAD